VQKHNFVTSTLSNAPSEFECMEKRMMGWATRSFKRFYNQFSHLHTLPTC